MARRPILRRLRTVGPSEGAGKTGGRAGDGLPEAVMAGVAAVPDSHPEAPRIRSQGAAFGQPADIREGRNRTQATFPEETARFARFPAVKCDRIVGQMRQTLPLVAVEARAVVACLPRDCPVERNVAVGCGLERARCSFRVPRSGPCWRRCGRWTFAAATTRLRRPRRRNSASTFLPA